MSEAFTFGDMVKSLTSDAVSWLVGVDSAGEAHRASYRSLANIAFTTVASDEDLDNPTTRGVFNINDNTVITRPSKGAGWRYGYVINIASPTGVQVWVNFSGYIAIRGKGSAGEKWSEWKVMQPME